MSESSRSAPATPGRRVLVTGAGSGIGLSLLDLLVGEGHTVIGTVRSPGKARRLQDERGFHGERVRFETLQLGEPSSIEALLERVGGPLDVLVNNAGYAVFGPIEELDVAAVRDQYQVNLLGPVQLTRGFLPALRESRGTVVWMGSLMHYVPLPFQAHYAASKAAVAAVSDALRLELAPWGVRVFCVEPGDFATEFTSNRDRSVGDEGPYGARIRKALEIIERDERTAPDGAEVAEAVLRLLRREDPPVRVPLGSFSGTIRALAGLLPDRLRLAILRRLYDPS